MGVKLTSERKLVLVIAIATVLLLVLSAYFGGDEAEQRLSTYSSRSGGAKATFLLIQQLGYSIKRWESSPASLSQDAEGTLLILAEPRRGATAEEKKALEKFVQRGGSLLACGYLAGQHLPINHARFEWTTRSWNSFPAMTPHALNRGVGAITMPVRQYWNTGEQELPLYGKSETEAAAVTYAYGKGRVIWLGSQIPLSNAGLKASGNAEFLANALSATNTRQVLWDVYFTEDVAGPRSSLMAPPVVAALAQVLFVFSLVLCTFSRRFGPLRRLPESTAPMSQLEFVHTLGCLYDSANATNTALEIAYDRFVFLVSRRLGLAPGTTTHAQLAAAIAQLLSEPVEPITELLMKCEEARYADTLSREDAIELTGRLRWYLVRLKLVPETPQEKR